MDDNLNETDLLLQQKYSNVLCYITFEDNIYLSLIMKYYVEQASRRCIIKLVKEMWDEYACLDD